LSYNPSHADNLCGFFPLEEWAPSSHCMTRRALGLLALTTIYFIAGKLGLQLAFVNASATAVWPPAGIAIGSLLLFGRGAWPAIAAGAFLVNITIQGDITSSVAIAAGNTIEALAGWWLTSRWAGGAAAFDRANTAFRFAVLAMVSPLAAATVGTASLLLTGLAAAQNWGTLWTTWWLGDAVGIVLVAPLMVLWARPSRSRWTAMRLLEMLAVIVIVGLTSWLVFGDSQAGVRHYPVQFLAVPVLFWPAFRLGPRETAAATILLSAIAVLGTLNGFGPFVRNSPNESLLFVQAFVGVWVVAMLAVSAEVQTREAVEGDVRGLNETLERRVAARSEEVSRMRDRLVEAQRVANVGSWEWDVVANTIWWSDELYRIFGQGPVAERTYESYLELLHPDDRLHVESAVGKALADGRPFSFEHRLLMTDGTERTIQADGQTIIDASGTAIRMVGTARDVTDRRRADDERIERMREQAARLEAEDANRAKDEFLATLSHELRTPLNAALGWTHMLRDVVTDDAGRTRAAEAILRNLQSQARLVSDMMDVSHITLRTLRLEQAPVNMVEVVRSAIESLHEPLLDRRITIDAALPSSEPAYVIGDDGRLQQVVSNLLSNAAKFSREGGIVRVRLGIEAPCVQLVVEDEGPGIAPEFLPHLFERFRQADSSATRAHGGLGLGLAIARHIVEAHQGTISAANRPEGGAMFTVVLPLAPARVGT
jgi:PAS domain S-box-containing protein